MLENERNFKNMSDDDRIIIDLKMERLMKKIIFFVPVGSADKVKQALFSTGAGRIGNYENCSFETLGTGQFRPVGSASPTIGKIDKLEKVEELKVEMICEDNIIESALTALRSAHPYEEPAVDVLELLNFD